MSNPYADAAFEVFDEALDALSDAREFAEMSGCTDFSDFDREKQIIESLAGDLRMKLKNI